MESSDLRFLWFFEEDSPDIDAIMCFGISLPFSPSHEAGIIYNDSSLSIDWILNKNEFILSERDLKLKSLSELK